VIATLDTNILLYASYEGSPRYPRARDLLEHLAAGPGLFLLLWPMVMGYLQIATHPAVFPQPLSADEATANVDSLLARPNVRILGETDGFWRTYRHVTADVRPRGKLVPDAHLAALMTLHGVSVIWTHDRDFRKFDGIAVRDPFDARYADGFG
jgi:toxin-antitoxin system PIN domain toxin